VALAILLHKYGIANAGIADRADAAIDELRDKPARGRRYNDGSVRIERMSVAGMKFMPDPAGQFVLIKACVETPPDTSHLGEPVGLYGVSDVFDLQDSVDGLFGRS